MIRSDDQAAARFNPPPPVPCQYCGAMRYTTGIIVKDRVIWSWAGPEPCTCAEAQAERAAADRERAAKEAAEEKAKRDEEDRARIRRIIGASGLGARFRNRNFETFSTGPLNVNAYRMARGYADNFAALQRDPKGQERNSILFTGPKGTGKTHLAAAIANQLMERGVPVVFATMIDLLAKIKNSFEHRDNGASEEEILRLYKTADLLIIDDIGKEQPTEWAMTKIYQIINARYEDYKPMILTSNYSAEELVERMTPPSGDANTADATVDRVLEMSYIVPIAGDSWRQK